MKKVIKIILIIVLAVVILTIGGCAVVLGIIGHKEKNYWKYSETSGDIETKYTAWENTRYYIRKLFKYRH